MTFIELNQTCLFLRQNQTCLWAISSLDWSSVHLEEVRTVENWIWLFFLLLTLPVFAYSSVCLWWLKLLIYERVDSGWAKELPARRICFTFTDDLWLLEVVDPNYAALWGILHDKKPRRCCWEYESLTSCFLGYFFSFSSPLFWLVPRTDLQKASKVMTWLKQVSKL